LENASGGHVEKCAHDPPQGLSLVLKTISALSIQPGYFSGLDLSPVLDEDGLREECPGLALVTVCHGAGLPWGLHGISCIHACSREAKQ